MTEHNNYIPAQVSMIINENQIPLIAKDIFKQASEETLNAGQTILKVIAGHICEVHPDGTLVKLKKTKTSIRIKNKHQKFLLR